MSSDSKMVVVYQEPPDDFRNVDIYPTQEEILGTQSFFRKNIIQGAFKNVEEYLDIQFRLLREDFVANLRDAIDIYQSKRQCKGIELYRNVVMRVCRGKYSTNCLKIKQPSEEGDKKFMIGSLLLFTKDNFRSMVLGKVQQKSFEEITVELIDTCVSEFELSSDWTMAECSQYFDPYFNVLKAFQSIYANEFPMAKYIVHVIPTEVYMPPYLLKADAMYEIENYRFLPEMLPLIEKKLLGLNSAQFHAFKAALTQEFVVIQGPPGTGKTHLGVKIASTLIKNWHLWYNNTPLLIVSHKNDALDQFLEGLLPITYRLIRMGNQSKSEKLNDYNLTNERSWNGAVRKRPREDYLRAMKKALVVGMTTSYAARWREHLERLKSPIVIVEEAAEVLEGHVVASLTHHCKHLILMGDHQQLQPISADHNIGKNYNLGISLFERMVINGVQHYQLNIQHRMRPEIANLLRLKIYPFLEDHESVLERPDIRGVAKNLFFIDHNHREETGNFTSKKNSYEAQFLVVFARYLILNGYDNPGDIVILATYAAQLAELERLVGKIPLLEHVRVSTLDGFQGQEADIVLLSLVRSDEIGFLGKENRVCVALSRAKNGLYIMGNMDLLARSSRLWAIMHQRLLEDNAVGKKLTLKCQNHGNLTEIGSLSEFHMVENGGCATKCGKRLICGHSCSFLCHNEDMVDHRCEKKCSVDEESDIELVVERDFDSNLWKEPSRNNEWRYYQNGQLQVHTNFWMRVWTSVKSFWNGLTQLFQ